MPTCTRRLTSAELIGLGGAVEIDLLEASGRLGAAANVAQELGSLEGQERRDIVGNPGGLGNREQHRVHAEVNDRPDPILRKNEQEISSQAKRGGVVLMGMNANQTKVGRQTLAVDYSAATLDPSPESQRALQQLRDEVVAEMYARIEGDVVELEVARMFEVAA